jgi:hypothetical protein
MTPPHRLGRQRRRLGGRGPFLVAAVVLAAQKSNRLANGLQVSQRRSESIDIFIRPCLPLPGRVAGSVSAPAMLGKGKCKYYCLLWSYMVRGKDKFLYISIRQFISPFLSLLSTLEIVWRQNYVFCFNLKQVCCYELSRNRITSIHNHFALWKQYLFVFWRDFIIIIHDICHWPFNLLIGWLKPQMFPR